MFVEWCMKKFNNWFDKEADFKEIEEKLAKETEEKERGMSMDMLETSTEICLNLDNYYNYRCKLAKIRGSEANRKEQLKNLVHMMPDTTRITCQSINTQDWVMLDPSVVLKDRHCKVDFITCQNNDAVIGALSRLHNASDAIYKADIDFVTSVQDGLVLDALVIGGLGGLMCTANYFGKSINFAYKSAKNYFNESENKPPKTINSCNSRKQHKSI